MGEEVLDFLRQRHREDLVQRRSNSNNSINNNNNNNDKEKGSLSSAKDNLMSDNKFVAIELVESFAMNKPQKRPGLAHIKKMIILSSFHSFGWNVGKRKVGEKSRTRVFKFYFRSIRDSRGKKIVAGLKASSNFSRLETRITLFFEAIKILVLETFVISPEKKF